MPDRTGSRGIVGCLLGLITVGLLVVGPTPGQASFPGANGKIVFSSSASGNSEIYVIESNGAGLTRLTNDPAPDTDPAWSPDGTKIAFVRGSLGASEIYVMNADGTGLTRVTDNVAQEADPAWSPDGAKIAFARSLADVGFQIFVMNVAGGAEARLTDQQGPDLTPSWSPDGTRIAFAHHETGFGPQHIYAMNADGSGITRLTTAGSVENSPDWSPDGTKIAFQSNRNLPGIWVMNSDGTSQAPLHTGQEPDWSPDGTKIVFTRSGAATSVIRIINADGTGETGPTDLRGSRSADWQPLAAPPPPPGSVMDDNFDDNSLDVNRWDVLAPPGGSIVEQNHRLEITVPSGFLGQGWGLRSRCSLEGDFDVQVDFAILDWPPGNLYVLRLGAHDLGPETGIVRVSTPSDSVYALLLDPSGVPAFSASTTDQSGSLRLVRSGSTLSGYYRQGDAWVLLGSGATSENPDSARLNIDSSSETPGAPPGRIAFDNFKVNAGNVVCPSPPPEGADLAITMTDSPDPVVSGNNLTYTITVTNSGPDGAIDVTLMDTLPANVTLVAVGTSQGACTGTTVVACKLGNLAGEASVSIGIVVKPSTDGQTTEITNTTAVTALEADPNVANNTATIVTTVRPSDAELAARFAPILVFDRDELFVPLDRERYVSERVTDLRERRIFFNPLQTRAMRRVEDITRDTSPTMPELGGLGTLDCPSNTLLRVYVDCYYFLDIERAEPRGGALLYFLLQFRLSRARTVYWHVRPYQSGHVALQYWFLYFFNDFGNRHEADWEHITLHLSPDLRPLASTYSSHGFPDQWMTSTDMDEAAVSLDERPVVYVANGSHASYFASGKYDVEVCFERIRDAVQDCAPLDDLTDGQGRVLAHAPVCEAGAQVSGNYTLVPLTLPKFDDGDYGSGNYIAGQLLRDKVSDPQARDDWDDPLSADFVERPEMRVLPGELIGGVRQLKPCGS
jgi:uncharacterized repeat protein (TIGR01451 family)